MQEDFFVSGRLKEHRSTLTKNINNLVEFGRKQNFPIIWVRQEFKKDLSDAPLYNKKNNKKITIENTAGSRLLRELKPMNGEREVIKKRFSAFFKTEFKSLLEQFMADTLIIAGISTMSCIRVTAIDAYQYDYNVILALDCVDSYDVEQHENSIKYLQYAVAIARTNEEIFRMFLT